MPEKKGRRGHNEGSIFYSESKGRWLGQLLIGYNDKGKPKRVTFYGKTRAEVKQKMDNRKVKIATHTFVEKKKITIYQLAKEIVMDKIDGNLVSENTHRRDLYTLSQLEGTDFADMNIQDVTPLHIKEFMNSTTEYANSSIVKIFRLLKKVFRRAVDRDIIIKNPMLAEETVRPKSKKPDKQVRALSPIEVNKLKSVIKGHKYENIILLMIYTGMRVGETLALSITDLHEDYIHVHRTLTRTIDDKVILGAKGKTRNADRNIPLVDKAKEVIKNALKEYSPNKEKLLFYNSEDDSLIIPGSINAYLRRINQIHHIAPYLHNHMFRHTYASLCLMAGLDPKAIQNRLGHADIETTFNVYVEEYQQSQIEDTDKLNDLLEILFSKEDNIIQLHKMA